MKLATSVFLPGFFPSVCEGMLPFFNLRFITGAFHIEFANGMRFLNPRLSLQRKVRWREV